jgi:hypothetical protein
MVYRRNIGTQTHVHIERIHQGSGVVFGLLCIRVLGRLADVRQAPSITIREMTDLVTASWETQEEVVFGE